jgi:Dolichyl-phosphate-mannose-protein mannosyltransferase
MSKLWPAVVCLIYAGFAVTLQYFTGAFKTGFDHHPDEPAHFVTGVMLREYVAQGFPSAPMAFAKDYYMHYPEVAFGHWPPVFYVLEAGWMLLFPPNHASVLLLLALLTVCTAFVLYRTASRYVSRTLGIIAGLTFIALPLTERYAAQVMIEAPLTLFGFIAALAVVPVLERCTWRSAAWFGVAASVVILTKSSGWSLAFVPIIAILLTRKWNAGIVARFLLSGGVVIAACVPFYIWTRRMAFAGTEGKPMTLRHVVDAMLQLIGLFPEMTGWVLILLAACGLVLKVILPVIKQSVQPIWAVMAAYLVSVMVFHAIAPTIVEPRKIAMTMPVLLAFSFAALDWIVQERKWLAIGGAAGMLIFFTVRTFYAAPPAVDAFAEPARFLLSDPKLAHELALVSSNHPGGEGAFIAEVAEREPHPIRILLRATKLLSSSTWNGLNYTLRYNSPEAVMTFLESFPIRIVVLNTSPGSSYAHHELLLRTLHQYAADWQLMTTGDQFEIYRLTKYIPNAPRKIQIDLRDKLNTILEYAPAR